MLFLVLEPSEMPPGPGDCRRQTAGPALIYSSADAGSQKREGGVDPVNPIRVVSLYLAEIERLISTGTG